MNEKGFLNDDEWIKRTALWVSISRSSVSVSCVHFCGSHAEGCEQIINIFVTLLIIPVIAEYPEEGFWLIRIALKIKVNRFHHRL